MVFLLPNVETRRGGNVISGNQRVAEETLLPQVRLESQQLTKDLTEHDAHSLTRHCENPVMIRGSANLTRSAPVATVILSLRSCHDPQRNAIFRRGGSTYR